MIYHGTHTTETIVVHPNNDERNHQFIDLIKGAEEQILTVQMDDGVDERSWDFYLDEPSDYERIKFNIMQSIFDTEDMDELGEVLDEIFNDGFESILIKYDDNPCVICPYKQ